MGKFKCNFLWERSQTQMAAYGSHHFQEGKITGIKKKKRITSFQVLKGD